MQNIAILGSTGSIGQSSLKVVRNFPDKFKVFGLAANSRIDLLYPQIKEFHPAYVCLKDIGAARQLKSRLKRSGIKVLAGDDGLACMLEDRRIDKVLLSISGSSALWPLLRAIENKKEIALANKEALVMAGPVIMAAAKRHQVNIIPVDSEQSAIWQCLRQEVRAQVKNIYLTASGGPFRKSSRVRLKNISVAQALRHPRWKMGKKISVDSATLMNKGLELLEAVYLFGIEPEKIKILIHPEAIIHSMVEFVDGVVLAQLSVTDMRIPIQYALSYPERLPNGLPSVNFCHIARLNFEKPDFRRFPCLSLAYAAAKKGGTAPCVLNAANEVSVDAFLRKRLKFLNIPKVIGKVLSRQKNILKPCLKEILQADAWAREEAYRTIERLSN